MHASQGQPHCPAGEAASSPGGWRPYTHPPEKPEHLTASAGGKHGKDCGCDWLHPPWSWLAFIRLEDLLSGSASSSAPQSRPGTGTQVPGPQFIAALPGINSAKQQTARVPINRTVWGGFQQMVEYYTAAKTNKHYYLHQHGLILEK